MTEQERIDRQNEEAVCSWIAERERDSKADEIAARLQLLKRAKAAEGQLAALHQRAEQAERDLADAIRERDQARADVAKRDEDVAALLACFVVPWGRLDLPGFRVVMEPRVATTACATEYWWSRQEGEAAVLERARRDYAGRG